MIDNETPVLRREDLIEILEALFKFSQDPNNALLRKEDGLYSFDFYQEFLTHINDNSVHPTTQETNILHNFSLVDDILCYKGEPIIIKVSDGENNAIQIKPDGLYIYDISNDFDAHANNDTIHITDQERQSWNAILQTAKDYVDGIIEAFVSYDIQLVDSLPQNEASIDPETIYALKAVFPDSSEEYRIRYLYRNHQWICLDLTNESYKLLARKQYVDQTFLPKNDQSVHSHDNKNVLDKFSESNNRLLYNNLDILDVMQISDDPSNAIVRGSDDKLYVKDLSSELAAIARQASLSKVIILEQDCNSVGIYTLEESIDNFNFLMIHYYLMPDDPNLDPYDAKMEMLDTDSLNDLYSRHIDYILEHDYGISTYNTKIRFYDGNKMQITYYNHVCIYKIIGVR